MDAGGQISRQVNRASGLLDSNYNVCNPGEPMRAYQPKPNKRLAHFQHLVELIDDVPGDHRRVRGRIREDLVRATQAIHEYFGDPPPGIQKAPDWNRWFLIKGRSGHGV
jgi:hypothetical protein